MINDVLHESSSPELKTLKGSKVFGQQNFLRQKNDTGYGRGMDDDYKARIRKRVENWQANIDAKAAKALEPKKVYDNPEERFGYDEFDPFAKKHGWFLSRVESKAKYSEHLDRYVENETEKGFSDRVGNDGHGRAMYVELKAPGCRSNLSYYQRKFLNAKIDQGCFAVVIDNCEKCLEQYEMWKLIDSTIGKKEFLRRMLPLEKIDLDADKELF